MGAQLKELYELQLLDIELAKAQRARVALSRGVEEQAQLDAARGELDVAEKSLLEATTENRDKELNVKTIESKRKTFQDKLYKGTVTSAKELSSMEKEIEMLGRQKDKLEERLIELMDIIEERKSAVETDSKRVKELEETLSAVLEKTKKENAVLVAKMRKLLPEREKAASVIDPVMLKRYDAARARQGGIAVSKVVDGDCTACHTQIGIGLMRELKTDGIHTCDNCGRMLYLEGK
jgi:hypothetical protein